MRGLLKLRQFVLGHGSQYNHLQAFSIIKFHRPCLDQILNHNSESTSGSALWSRALFTSMPLQDKKWFTKETRKEYSVDTQELNELVEKDQVYLVDVREPEEVAAGRVPAKRYVHVPLGHFYPDMQLSEKEFYKKYGKEKPQKDANDIVFLCRGGIRSTFALQLAQDFGYTKSKHYKDGYRVWEESNK